MPKAVVIDDSTPVGLKPFKHHGLDISWRKGEKNATSTCPFCGKGGKFCIHVDSGQWRCLSCNEGFDKKDANGQVRAIKGGNALEFLRLLWRYCEVLPIDYTELVKDRTLLDPAVLIRWEVTKSIITDEWMMPGYNTKGELTQLYRYVNMKNPKDGTWKRRLIPTPEVGEAGHRHGIFGMAGFDPKRPIIDVLESWNGLVFEEVITQEEEFIPESRNVIAFPGCATFDQQWLPLFKGKVVNFWFDNDHPKTNEVTKAVTHGAGWLYSNRNATTLQGIAKEVNVLHWGEKGFDPELPSGYDVRDVLGGQISLLGRSKALRGLLPKLKPIALNAKIGPLASDDEKHTKLPPKECTEFATLVRAWKLAFRWRKELENALAVCLAVCLSTEQVGDQLFLLLVADAGSGKTNFCDAMLVSEGCYPVENVNGLHSGWQGGGYSAIDRMNRKTWITAEGDTVVNHPAFAQFMSQVRRAFDGKSHASYKNSKVDQDHSGLRTPWIMAGTPAIIDMLNQQANLGDRFLKYFIRQPDNDEKRQILLKSVYSEMNAVKKRSGEDAENQLSPELCEAYQLTGGYVDYLRSHTELLEELEEVDEETLIKFTHLGEFAACLRARPGKTKSDETHDAKEMPTRLSKQFVRAAMCLAVVLNKPAIDQEVLDTIRYLTLCTASGHTRDLINYLYKEQSEGMLYDSLSILLSKTHEKTRELLRFLKKINLVEWFDKDPQTGEKIKARWRLSPYMLEVYESVMKNWR